MTGTPPDDFEPGEGEGDEEMEQFLEQFLKDANDIGIVSSQFQESGIEREDITDCDEADLRELLDSIGIAVKYRNRIVRGMRKTHPPEQNNNNNNSNQNNNNHQNQNNNNNNNNNHSDLATDSRLNTKQQALVASVNVKLSNGRTNIAKIQTAIADVEINKQQIMGAIKDKSQALTDMALSQIQMRVKTNIETAERISEKKASLLEAQLFECQKAVEVLVGIQKELRQILSATSGKLLQLNNVLTAVPGKLAGINSLLDADLKIQANGMILEYKCDEAPLKQLLSIKNTDLDSVLDSKVVDKSNNNNNSSGGNHNNPNRKILHFHVYTCKKCGIDLFLDKDIQSRTHKLRGKAYLVANAINFLEGEAVKESYTSGIYFISPISCLKCKTDMGTKYVGAELEKNKYKIGMYLIAKKYFLSPDDRIQAQSR